MTDCVVLAMSRCHNIDISNKLFIFALKMSLLSKRHLMTVVINMHKPSFIFITCVMPVLCTPLQVKCYQSVLHNGVYRNMRKLKNQNQALVQLHFSSFYQGALGKKKHYWCASWDKTMALSYFKIL